MKKYQKLMFLLLIFLVNKKIVMSQTIPGTKLEYTYDANGNRIVRTKINVLLLSKFNIADTISKKKEIPKEDLLSNFNIVVGTNPTNSNITIELKSSSTNTQNEFEYTITSSSGTLLLNNKVFSKTTNIDLSGLTDGLYLLKLVSNNKIYIYKIVKTNY